MGFHVFLPLLFTRSFFQVELSDDTVMRNSVVYQVEK